MIDFFTRIYTSIRDKNDILKRLKFYSLQRFLVRNIANAILPSYFTISNLFRAYKLKKAAGNRVSIIVSLTTFPARVNKVWMVIESVLRQDTLPDRIILWLSEEQFSSLSDVPKKLLKLQQRGLEIIIRPGDLRSHKKYYYAIELYPKDVVITIDDDMFYPSNTLSELLSLSEKYPGVVCCHRGSTIAVKDNDVLPYKEWGEIDNNSNPSYDILPTGCGGILYPPGALSAEVLNKAVFMAYCKHADDIWLYAMAQFNGTKLVKTNSNNILIPVVNKADITLASINVDENLNDKQLNEIRAYYKTSLNIDMLSHVFN